MSRRLGLIALSLVVALLGTAAVYGYVSRVEARVLAGSELVDVLVATSRIPAGTSAADATEAELVEVVSMPRRNVPEGALADVGPVSSRTLVSDVFAGEVLLSAKFADGASAQTGALTIPQGLIAVSVELGDPQRVAGFVRPGAEVAVFATVDASPPDHTQAGAAGATDGGRFTQLLLPRAAVIAVGPATLKPPTESEDPREEIATAVLTLAVAQPEAVRLIHSAQTGDLYFGLLSPSSKTGAGSGVSDGNLFALTRSAE